MNKLELAAFIDPKHGIAEIIAEDARALNQQSRKGSIVMYKCRECGRSSETATLARPPKGGPLRRRAVGEPDYAAWLDWGEKAIELLPDGSQRQRQRQDLEVLNYKGVAQFVAELENQLREALQDRPTPQQRQAFEGHLQRARENREREEAEAAEELRQAGK